MQEIFTFCFLVKPATPEVVGDNHIRHRVENKLDVLCVGGAGHVAVNLLRRRLVLRLKLGLDIHSVSVCVKNTSTQIQIHKYKDANTENTQIPNSSLPTTPSLTQLP